MGRSACLLTHRGTCGGASDAVAFEAQQNHLFASFSSPKATGSRSLDKIGFSLYPTPAGKLLLTMLAGLAKMELETLRERQRIGIDRAKQEGKYTGRKPVDSKIIDTALQLKGNGLSIDAIAAQLKLGRSTLYREFDRRRTGAANQQGR